MTGSFSPALFFLSQRGKKMYFCKKGHLDDWTDVMVLSRKKWLRKEE
jgi:hypothetical protein